ncbi:MAG TPA: EcsC family protein [Thermoanaerobaculia bacterium]
MTADPNPAAVAVSTRGRKLKKKADSVLAEVFESLFEEIDTPRIKREVEQLRSGVPGFDPIDYAKMLSRRTAIRCAAAGAMTGLPSGVLALATLGADLAYLVYQQFRLILGIATIYGYEPSHRERFSEALACLAYGSGVGLGKQGVSAALGSIEAGIVAEKIGSRAIRERLGKFIPFIGALSGGVLNYVAVQAVGRATIRYYESKIDPALADEIWAEGDREHA